PVAGTIRSRRGLPVVSPAPRTGGPLPRQRSGEHLRPADPGVLNPHQKPLVASGLTVANQQDPREEPIMRTNLIRDLKDCNQFRQTIQSKPPCLVHGVVLLLVALVTAATLWAAYTRANLVVRAVGRVRPVTTPKKVYVTRAENL